MSGNVKLPGQVTVTSGQAEVPVGSPGKAHPTLPQEALVELRSKRALLDLEFAARAEWTAKCQAMDAWTGSAVKEAAVRVLFSDETPAVLAEGMTAQRERRNVEEACAAELRAGVRQRQEIAAHLAALETRYTSEHAASQVRITALQSLQPLAQQVMALRTRLHATQFRYKEQDRQAFRSLWNTLSGQRSASQQEITRLQMQHDALVRDFRLQRHGRSSLQEVLPEHVEVLLDRELQSQVELNEWENRERQTLDRRVQALDHAEASTRARLTDAQATADTRWQEAQRHHQVPEWSTWERLWADRTQAADLWRAREDAAARLHGVTRALERIWNDWPAADQNLAALRRRLDETEAAIKARQDQEAQHEKARQEAHLAHLQQTLLAVLAERLDGVSAGKTSNDGPPSLAIGSLHAGTQGHELPSPSTTPQPQPILPPPTLPPVQPAPLRAQEAAGIETVPEEQDRKGEHAIMPPAPPVPAPSPRVEDHPLRPEQTARGNEDASSAPPSLNQATPVLQADQQAEAKRMLVRHASSAAQAAMCLEALQEWSGPGVDAVRLAALVSRTLPAELEWTTRMAQVKLGPPQDGPPVPSFAELQLRYGLPVQAERWASLWTDRMKGVTLLESWRAARESLTQQEARMAELWRAWPAALQNVDALRKVTLGAQAPASPQVTPVLPAQASRHRTLSTPGPTTLECAPPTVMTQAGVPTVELPAPVPARSLTQRSGVRNGKRPLPSLPLPGRPAPPPHPPLIQAPTAAHSQESATTRPALEVRSPLPGQERDLVPVQAVVPSGPQQSPKAVLDAVIQEADRAEVLLRNYERASARLAMCQEGLSSWAGQDVDGLKLGEFVSRPLPQEVETALARWQDEKRDHATPIPPSTGLSRQSLHEAIEAERQRGSDILGPLRLLQLEAPVLIAAEQELHRASSGSRRRRESRLASAQESYASRAQALGFGSPPPPRDLASMIKREEQEFVRRMAPLEAAWKDVTQSRSPQPVKPALPGSSAVPRGLGAARRAWEKLSGRYGLPARPERFEALWRQRGRGAELWASWLAAQEEQTAVEAGLDELWREWPEAFRTVSSLEQALRAARPVRRVPDTAKQERESSSSSTVVDSLLLRLPPPAPWATSTGATSTRTASTPTERGSRLSPGPAVPLPLTPVQPVEEPRRATVISRPPTPPATPASRRSELRSEPARSASVAQARQERPDQHEPKVFPASPGVLPRPGAAQPGPKLPAPQPPAAQPPAPARVRPPLPRLPGLPGQPRPGGLPLPARPPAPSSPPTLPGRLTQRERAEREAVRISERYSWARGFVMLADALDRKNWGQLRQSIEREIACGMTPEEFELVLQLRAYWHEQVHFQSPYSARYDSLPWGLALNLIRRTCGVPSLEEMIILIERFYDHADVACSRRALPAFSQRLGVLLAEAEPGVDLEYWLCVLEARCFSR